MVEQRFVAGVVGSALIRIASGFSMSKPTVKFYKCMISLIGFMILRFFVLILEIVKYKKLITSFFLRFCALLRFCTWRNGKTIRKTSFRVVIVQRAAHCEAVSMVNRSRKR